MLKKRNIISIIVMAFIIYFVIFLSGHVEASNIKVNSSQGDSGPLKVEVSSDSKIRKVKITIIGLYWKK